MALARQYGRKKQYDRAMTKLNLTPYILHCKNPSDGIICRKKGNMEILSKKTFRQFQQDLRWSTRVYVLIAVVLGLGAFFLGIWGPYRAVAMIFAIALVLFTELAARSLQRHANTWRITAWALLLILAALLLIGWQD